MDKIDKNSADGDRDAPRNAEVISNFDSGSVLDNLVRIVSEATDEDPLEMPPLAREIDPDALEQFIQSSAHPSTRVSFRFNGCEITVNSGGEITVAAQR